MTEKITDVTIRYADPGDLAALRGHDNHIAGAELEKCVRDRRVIVVCRGAELIGWLRFGLFWDSIPFMNMLYIVEGQRGRGFGGRLTSFWEGEMAKAGYDMLLTSTQSNENAQFFYRKLGYTECGALVLPGEPLEMIFMKKLQ